MDRRQFVSSATVAAAAGVFSATRPLVAHAQPKPGVQAKAQPRPAALRTREGEAIKPRG
jgi:hypothetical protein